MRELLEQLETLKQRWYASDIDAEEFAYAVFEIKEQLGNYLNVVEGNQA